MTAAHRFLLRPAGRVVAPAALVSLLGALALGLGACVGAPPYPDVEMVQSEPDLNHPTLPRVETSSPPANLSDADRARLAGLYDPAYVPQPPPPQPPPPQPPPPPQSVAQPPSAPAVCQPCQQFEGRLWYVNSRIANLERSNASLRQNADLGNPAIQNAIAQDEGRIAELKEQKAQLEAEKAKCEKTCGSTTPASVQPPAAPAASVAAAVPAPQPVAQPQPPANDQAAQKQYWWNFYCDNPAGYYGIVSSCSLDWRPVAATASYQVPRYSAYCDDPPGYYPDVAKCTLNWRWVALSPSSPLATPAALQPEAPAPAPIPPIGIGLRWNMGGGRSDK